MHTTRVLGRLGLRGGDLRLWRNAALCGLLAAIATAAVGSSPALAAGKDYKICTVTSDIMYAGTDSRVQVRLYGSKGMSPKVELDHPNYDDFERGKADCFTFTFADLGTLYALDVDVDCDECWRLDSVWVNGFKFPYYNWVPDAVQTLHPV